MSNSSVRPVFAVKSAVRHFRKHAFYHTLNIAGLSVAFAVIILSILYLNQELTYENFHKKADRIYRPTYHISSGKDFEVHFARIPEPYINDLPAEIPEIEKLIRFQNQEQKYIRIGEKRFKPRYAYITDHDVFDVFDLPMVEGDPKTALAEPHSVVLTESLARKYFSGTQVLGKEINVTGNWTPEEQIYRVTGVISDLPVNTHLPIDMLFSFGGPEERSGWAYVYTLLREGADIAAVEAKMPDFISKHAVPESTRTLTFPFQRLKDIHLHSHLAREIVPNGDAAYIRIFFWVGLFVWLIALVNFANMSAALTMTRGKELGVRSVLGARKGQLVLGAVSETIVWSFAALAAGALIAGLVFPAFTRLTGISILPPLLFLAPVLLGIAILSGLLAGVLPAVLAASVRALQVIRMGQNWTLRSGAGSINVKRLLIAVQFCVAIVLIGSAIVAHLQFRYIQDLNLGLKPEQILAISTVPDRVTDQYLALKNRLQSVPGVTGVAACMQTPSTEIRDSGPVLVRGANEDPTQAPMMDIQVIDPDFVDMMGLELEAGEDFTAKVKLKPAPEFNENLTVNNYLAESPKQYLINETAMKQLGWQSPEEALGKEINWSIGDYRLAFGPVAGVIRDYHQESLKNKVDPLVMVIEPIWLRTILVKVDTRDLEKTMAGIEDAWNGLFPYALEYDFLDDLFNRLYDQDRVQLRLLSTLALIAVLIAFLGLVSLVAYALRRRSKELAIRRVIGADLGSLTGLMSREYLVVLAVAAAAAVPLSYRWVKEWLENFAYHIEISPWVYLVAVASVYAALLLVIYLQTMRATIANPVKSLRED